MKKDFLLQVPNWILLSFVLDSFIYNDNSVTLEDVLVFVWKQCLRFKCTSLYDIDNILHCLDHLEGIKHIAFTYSDDNASILYHRTDLYAYSKN